MPSLRFIQPSRRLLLSAAKLSVVLAGGCASDPALDEETELLAQTVTPGDRTQVTNPPAEGPVVNPRDNNPQPPADGPVVNPRDNNPQPPADGPVVNPRDNNPEVSPDAPTTMAVRAFGSGCPSGTFVSGITADGLTATIQLSAYFSQIDGQASTSTDCTLRITPRDVGRSYAVSSFQTSGYLVLESGSRAEFRVRYWGDGAAEPAWSQARGESSSGPRSFDWAFVDQVEEGDRSWSSCGEGVTVSTNLALNNGGTSRSFGYIIAETMVVNLVSRVCGSSATPR